MLKNVQNTNVKFNWKCTMTNVVYKVLMYLSIYLCLTCFGFSFSPSSEAGVQPRQWFKVWWVWCQRPGADTILEPLAKLYTCLWRYDIYDIWYDIWYHIISYDIYLTALGLTPGGNSTSHIYTVHRIQRKENWEVRAVPRICELYPGICLTTEEKARKNLIGLKKKARNMQGRSK
jgi:hypothetical protein